MCVRAGGRDGKNSVIRPKGRREERHQKQERWSEQIAFSKKIGSRSKNNDQKNNKNRITVLKVFLNSSI